MFDMFEDKLKKAKELVNQASAFYDKKDNERAKELYSQALDIFSQVRSTNPKDPYFGNDGVLSAIYHDRGCAYFYIGNLDLAVNDLSHSIALNKKNTGSYVMRSRAYVKLGKIDLAKKDLESALEVAPLDSDALHDFGLLYHNHLKEYSKAAEYYTKVAQLEKSPLRYIAYFNRGLIRYYYQKNQGEAFEDFKKAIELRDTYARAHDMLGLCYQNQGDTEKAIHHYERAVTLDPNLREAQKALENLKEESKKMVVKGEVSTTDFTAIAGMDELKKKLQIKVLEPLKNPELAKKFKQQIAGGLILYGPPGCGKTYIIRALAGEAKMKLFIAKVSDILDKWVGNSEKNLHMLFEQARKEKPSIIFMDELDGLGWRRSQEDHSWERNFISQLLVELDNGDGKNNGIIILGATNAPWFLDAALKRSGRFGTTIYVPAPDEKTRMHLFEMYTKDLPLEPKLPYKEFARKTQGYSCADVQSICERAAQKAYERSISENKESVLTRQDIEDSILQERSDIIEWFASLPHSLSLDEMKTLYPELFEDVTNMKLPSFHSKEKKEQMYG